MTDRVALARALASAALAAACLALPGVASAQVAGAPVTPIPTDPNSAGVDDFEGSTATANKVTAPAVPQNPFMAPNGRNNIHDDGYMTDTYTFGGPMGDGPEFSSLFFRECASVMFDSQGRIVTICVGLDRPVLALLNPHSLAVLAAMPLPVRNLQSGNNPFNDFSGGGYFYLDHQDRAVLGTNDRHVLEVAVGAGPSLVTTRDIDLSQKIDSNDGIISVLPDWKGRFWFVTRRGTVGTIDRASGEVQIRKLGEGISNSFAVDETGGVFVVSDKALYRFDAGNQGEPVETWRVVYPNSNIVKPSQSDAGSGTTPTLMGDGKNGWVAITDNADPMNVQVYERAAKLESPAKAKPKKKKKRKKKPAAAAKKKKKKRKKPKRNEAKQRQVCSEPVFRRGASATDNSLIGTEKSLVVENNYGYSGITSTMQGGVTQPGITRVDVEKVTTKAKKRKKPKGKKKTKKPPTAPSAAAKKKKKKKKRGKPATTFRCKTVWTSNERAPSVVPKLSLANGLVYTYTKPQRSDGRDAWFLTALDFRNGQTIFSRLSGVGFGFNNNYAPVTLSPDGNTAYVGVLGGIIAFR